MTSMSANWPNALASRPKPPASRRNAAELPALREAEARAAAGLPAPHQRARKRWIAKRNAAKERAAELDRRLTQFASDVDRGEQRQSSDADVACNGLDIEDTELKDEIKSRVETRSGVDERGGTS